jgi:ribosomal protein S18 acetylase RimI-like enzyme
MKIDKATDQFIPLMSKLHLNSFDRKHFTSRFDEKLLNRYISVLLKKNPFSYIALNEEEDEIAGYLICGNETKEAVTMFLKENIIKVFRALLLNPSFLFEKIAEILQKLYPKMTRDSKVKTRLFIIVVSNKYQGKGIGVQLLNFLEKELHKNNIFEYGLSVRKGNEPAIKFYNNHDFIVEFENKKSIYYSKKI